MNSTGVLDDYLDELLGEAIAPAVVLPTPDSVAPAPAPASISQPDHEPTWDDLPAEVIYETDTVAAACRGQRRARSRLRGRRTPGANPPGTICLPR